MNGSKNEYISKMLQLRWILTAGLGLGFALTVITFTIMVPGESSRHLFSIGPTSPLFGLMILTAILAVAVNTLLDTSQWTESDRACPKCDGRMAYGVDTGREMYYCQVCSHYEEYKNYER